MLHSYSLINTVHNNKLDLDLIDKKEKCNMCQAWEEILEDERNAGREEMRKQCDIFQQAVELEKARADNANLRADEEKARADNANLRADEEKARADEEKARADEEKARADNANLRADKEKLRADNAMHEIFALKQRLRDVGIMI